MKKSSSKNIKNLVFSLVVAVVILFAIFSTPLPAGSKNPMDVSFKNAGIYCYETFNSLGNGALSVYILYGQIAYDSITQIDDMGYGVIAIYELIGHSAYRGIIETINSYKDFFSFVSQSELSKVRLNSFILDYSANVSGGVETVSDFLKKNLKIL